MEQGKAGIEISESTYVNPTNDIKEIFVIGGHVSKSFLDGG